MAFVVSSGLLARRGLSFGSNVCGTMATMRRAGRAGYGRASLHTTPVSMKVDVAEVTDSLMKLYDEVPCQPIMVRLAWHDAGTFDKDQPETPGADASIRFSPEKDHGANNGLGWAMDTLEPIKEKFPEISYADLYQLASVVAVAHAGGPEIPFKLGRKDALPEDCTPDGRLPAADKRMGHLRDIFYRMGFNDAEIVALSGAHTLGKAHKDRSGFEGPWTHEMLKFDNSYFTELVKEEADPALLKLESDLALMDEPNCKALVEEYAANQDKFFEDYAKAHQKLSELGWDL
uniref:Plant heme peroxidase family profile domain-containing protein n=1 Tax=Rhodosorus marinus TaxID=101924 RepID=A0A7S0BK01_9RHOD|mmetsp:Transcript_2035/g.3055  ORF Transcript_2035/g.3055 Transcript_2035/m.3055 type:complete len:289 (+) Transcript_2035:79-945(+)